MILHKSILEAELQNVLKCLGNGGFKNTIKKVFWF